jgi:CHASE2 domain-containing sensor protein
MQKIKEWFNLNRNVIAVILFLISLVLSCFNLFTRLHNIPLTCVTFVILGCGWGIMIYDMKKRKKND